MSPPIPPPEPPAATIADVIARMQSIDAVLARTDGVACFNRMYLQITQSVEQAVQGVTFADPDRMAALDVAFANFYFAAADSLNGPPAAWPVAWQPLLAARAQAGIDSIQFALAGMNAHINHDLPLAVVATCAELGCTPGDGTLAADYQKVDAILDAAEQAERESFEPTDVRDIDEHTARVLNLLSNWSINSARDVAWDNALVLWELRDHHVATDLFTGALARTVAMASRVLLVAV